MSPGRRLLAAWARVLAVAALVVGAPVLGIVLARAREAAAHTGPTGSGAAAAAPGLATSPVPNDFVGVLLPPQMANLSPRADGRVLSVAVKLGQRVRAGDVLVIFDPREKQHDLAMADAQLGISRADAAGAGSDLVAARKRAARRNATVTVGGQRIALVSGEEAAQAHFEAQSAAARAASASAKIAEQRAKVQQLRLALEETELRAPFDGMVTAVNFEPGMTAHPGDVVARVVGGTGLRARIAVPEEAVDLLPRHRARLTLDTRALFAAIDQVALEVEPASRSFIIEGPVAVAPDTCAGDCAMLAGRAVRASLLPTAE
jgi:RND family efflux transporter MFP subunit